MASSRTFLINASTRHAIFVGRYAGSQLKEIAPYLERVKQETLAKLGQKSITELNKSRLQAVLAEIDKELIKIYEQIGKKITKNMKEFANYEADFSARMFTKATNTTFTVPAKSTIEAAIFSEALLSTTESLSIEQVLRSFSKAKRQEIGRIIRNGSVIGKTNDEIIKDIEFATDRIQMHHAYALVRTVTNFVSMAARQSTINDNSDIIMGVEWVSTLDSSTTETCQALDGQIFAEGEGPRPPVHWGCRSTVIPKIKPEYSVLDKINTERPAVNEEGAQSVSGKTTYNSWLKQQSKEFQDEVLGATKGQLFRDGGLDVRQFVDKNYQPLTLDQLRNKEPSAFTKAGLDEE